MNNVNFKFYSLFYSESIRRIFVSLSYYDQTMQELFHRPFTHSHIIHFELNSYERANSNCNTAISSLQFNTFSTGNINSRKQNKNTNKYQSNISKQTMNIPNNFLLKFSENKDKNKVTVVCHPFCYLYLELVTRA